MSEITFSERGVVELNLGGSIHRLRYRAHEISLLEGRMGKGIMALLGEENLGLTFLKNAIIVGIAHEYTSKKNRKSLTEKMVMGWIDATEDNGVPFDTLLEMVAKAVVSGLPGGQKYMDEWAAEAAEEDGDEGNGEPAHLPALP